MKETVSLYDQFVMRLEQSYGYSVNQFDRNVPIDGKLVADIAVWKQKQHIPLLIFVSLESAAMSIYVLMQMIIFKIITWPHSRVCLFMWR